MSNGNGNIVVTMSDDFSGDIDALCAALNDMGNWSGDEMEFVVKDEIISTNANSVYYPSMPEHIVAIEIQQTDGSCEWIDSGDATEEEWDCASNFDTDLIPPKLSVKNSHLTSMTGTW